MSLVQTLVKKKGGNRTKLTLQQNYISHDYHIQQNTILYST